MLCKDYQGAREDASQVIAFAPFNASAYCNRAWAYLFDLKTELAIKETKKSLKYEKLGEAHCILALAKLQEEDFTEALAISRLAIALKGPLQDYKVPTIGGSAVFIQAHLYRLQGNEEAFKDKLHEAQELGDNVHLFNLLEEWIALVSKNFTERKEKMNSFVDKGVLIFPRIFSPAFASLSTTSLRSPEITEMGEGNDEDCEETADYLACLALEFK